MKRLFNSVSQSIACSALALLAACGDGVSVNVTYRLTETQDGLYKSTVRRINDDVTLETQELAGNKEPQTLNYKCSERTNIETAIATAEAEQKKTADEVAKMIENVTRDKIDSLLEGGRKIALSNAKLSGARSVAKACDFVIP